MKMNQKLAVVLVGATFSIAASSLPSYASGTQNSFHSNKIQPNSTSQLLIAQARGNEILSPNQSIRKTAISGSGRFSYSQWKYCFSSIGGSGKLKVSRQNGRKSVTLNLPNQKFKCLPSKANNRTYIFKNVGNTRINYSSSPTYID